MAHERALRLVRAACAAGEPQAHALLATFLRDGIGTPPDLAAALEALRNGAELGCPDALTCLAESHAIEFPAWRGSQDRAATLRFLRRAADADWPIALSRLIAGVAGEYWPDLGRAEVDGYMSRACTLGAVDAITTIGSCYELGKGVRPDDERAFVHYRAGYQLGDPVGALMYAEKLVQGRGGAAGVGVAAALLDDLLADRYLVPENKSWVREYAARLLADVRVSGTAGAKDPCSICSGRGWVPRVGLPPPSLTAGQPSSRMTCQGCYGSGRRL